MRLAPTRESGSSVQVTATVAVRPWASAGASVRLARPSARALAFLVFLAAFAAAFFPARTASAFKSLEALEPLGSLAGFCDVLGATGMAPAGPLVLAQDEATLIASALAAGISDPRGASMTAPLFVVELDSGAIAALDDLRCERASRALPNAPDDSKNAPDTAPPADVDPAVPAVALQLFAFQVEAPETIAPSATDAMLPGHPRDVEHPPRLSRRHP